MGVRQVHLFEPYWNKIRETQVIGRARRKYSHYHLPKEEQDVEVFSYVNTFSDNQKKNKWFAGTEKEYILYDSFEKGKSENIDLNTFKKSARAMMNRLHDDVMKNDDFKTSDEILREKAIDKFNVISTFIHSIKEACIDCTTNLSINQIGETDEIICSRTSFIDRETQYAFEFENAELVNSSIDHLKKEREEIIKVIRQYNQVLDTSFRFIINTKNNTIYDFYAHEGYSEHAKGTSIPIGVIDGDKYSIYPKTKIEYIVMGELIEQFIGEHPEKTPGEIYIEYKRHIQNTKESTVDNKDEIDPDVLAMASMLGLA